MTSVPYRLPDALIDEEDDEDHVQVCKSMNRRKNKKNMSLRQKIIKKKEQQRRKGMVTRPDTKYTGRKRPNRF